MGDFATALYEVGRNSLLDDGPEVVSLLFWWTWRTDPPVVELARDILQKQPN